MDLPSPVALLYNRACIVSFATYQYFYSFMYVITNNGPNLQARILHPKTISHLLPSWRCTSKESSPTTISYEFNLDCTSEAATLKQLILPPNDSKFWKSTIKALSFFFNRLFNRSTVEVAWPVDAPTYRGTFMGVTHVTNLTIGNARILVLTGSRQLTNTGYIHDNSLLIICIVRLYLIESHSWKS